MLPRTKLKLKFKFGKIDNFLFKKMKLFPSDGVLEKFYILLLYGIIW